MSTTLASNGFDAGTSGNAITTSNSTFDGASSPGIVFDSTHAHSPTLSAKVTNTAQGTRGLWWSSGSMGGNQSTIFGRLYVYFTAAPPALVRWVNVQSGGNVLLGIGLTTSRTVQIRNVKAGSTVDTSTTVLATNTWHRIEYSITMSATAAAVTVRIYAGANADTTTISETISGTGLALAATSDSIMHGQAFSAAQTYTSWLDDVKLQVGSGATWLGPSATSGGGGTTGGDYTLVYDMNADTWSTTSAVGDPSARSHPWAVLPNAMAIYPASQGQWGYTAPEHITSGTYADGTRYVQLVMKKLAAGAPHARFGAGDYGCRFHFADEGVTSITTGRYQWTEEWTGARKVKTSMMGWFDRNTRLTRDGAHDPHWPDAGERDLLEQWESTVGGKLTWHKGPLDASGHHPQSPHQWGNSVNTANRTTFRVTITATKATMEVLQSDGTWRTAGTPETNTSFFQPDRAYHYEGALAYSSPNSSKNDPDRGNAIRKISNLKVWSGTDPGGGGGGGTDSTAPTPNPPAAPTAVASTTSVAAIVTLTACTDAGSGVDYYEAQRAYDNAGTPNLGTLVTLTPLRSLTFTDTGVVGGDKVYYRERCLDQSGNPTSWSSWSAMLTIPSTTIDKPQCVLAVAPDDGSIDAADNVTIVDDGSPGVIFSAPATIGAQVITVDPGYEGAPLLTILPAEGATDPNTGQVLFIYPAGVGSYVAKGTAQNAGGADSDTAIVNIIAGTAGNTATPSPRDVWLVPGNPAYRAGDLVDNDLYTSLALDQDDAVPRLTRVNGFLFCVDKGVAGPTVDTGGGGNDNDPDLLIVSGNVAVASNVYSTGYTMGDDGELTQLRSYVETAPVGGEIDVVWKRNGSAIGTVTILAGQTNGTLTVDVVTATGDVLTWDVTHIGAGTVGANLHASWSGAV